MAKTISEMDKIISENLDDLALGKEKEVIKIFKELLIEVKLLISDAFEKYAIGGFLTIAEMRKFQRLLRLEKNIFESIKPYMKDVNGILTNYPAEFYAETYHRQEWKFANISGVKMNFGVLNEDQILFNLENEFDKIAKDSLYENLKIQLRKVINTGLIVGQSYPKMIKLLNESITKIADRANNILRTELATARNQATNAGYDKAVTSGIKGETVWDAALDIRTRQSHGVLDNVPKNDKGGWDLGGILCPYPAYAGLPAGERINCRCTLRFNPSGFTPKIRRTREDGIIPYQTYTEYFSGKKLFG